MANEHALASAGEPQCEMTLAALVLERAVTRNVLGCAGEALDLDRAAHAMRAGHGADAHPLVQRAHRKLRSATAVRRCRLQRRQRLRPLRPPERGPAPWLSVSI